MTIKVSAELVAEFGTITAAFEELRRREEEEALARGAYSVRGTFASDLMGIVPLMRKGLIRQRMTKSVLYHGPETRCWNEKCRGSILDNGMDRVMVLERALPDGRVAAARLCDCCWSLITTDEDDHWDVADRWRVS